MNYILWDLLGPASWPFWLILAAAAALMFRSDRAHRFARWSALAAVLLVIALGVLPTGNLLMTRLEAAYPRPQHIPGPVRHIVVLGGAEHLLASAASGSLEFSEHGERIAEAVALAERYPSADLWIVGGVSLGQSRRDVDWTADYWVRAGVDSGRVRKIAGTFDTCGNALGISAALPHEPILLVTSGFHLPRALACMKRYGVDAAPYAVDRQGLTPDRLSRIVSFELLDNLDRTQLALHEYVGLLYYRLSGRID